MRLHRFLVSAAGAVAVLGLLLMAPKGASAQTVSPCCDKICNTDGSSTACNEIVLGGVGVGGALARGCIDAETGTAGDVCYGGLLLGSSPPALLSGCLCILGGPGGIGSCVDGSGATLTPAQCTAAAVANCGTNVNSVPNDSACGPGACPQVGCCVGSNSCTNLQTAATCAGNLVADHVCGDVECAVCTDDASCDDGDVCNGSETCDPATGCHAGTPLSCDDGDVCNGTETCDSTTGGCAAGTPLVCDDGDACNGTETCDSIAGGCAPGTPVNCDDGDPCNGSETCDSATGGCNPGTPVDCSDGLACNGSETCDSATGDCVPGTPVDCNDNNSCTTDTCNEPDGSCTNSGACPPECGNGVVEAGEACDDGNLVDGDGCDSNCTPTSCGNGVVTAGELCDDGNTADGDGCDSNCTVTGCGNGIITAGEECDDGNTANDDGCSSTCLTEFCGDGTCQAGESCSSCAQDCGAPTCCQFRAAGVKPSCDTTSYCPSECVAAGGTSNPGQTCVIGRKGGGECS